MFLTMFLKRVFKKDDVRWKCGVVEEHVNEEHVNEEHVNEEHVYEETDTYCDKCKHLSECRKKDMVVENTLFADRNRHFIKATRKQCEDEKEKMSLADRVRAGQI
jgi:hypothetical protein